MNEEQFRKWGQIRKRRMFDYIAIYGMLRYGCCLSMLFVFLSIYLIIESEYIFVIAVFLGQIIGIIKAVFDWFHNEREFNEIAYRTTPFAKPEYKNDQENK